MLDSGTKRLILSKWSWERMTNLAWTEPYNWTTYFFHSPWDQWTKLEPWLWLRYTSFMPKPSLLHCLLISSVRSFKVVLSRGIESSHWQKANAKADSDSFLDWNSPSRWTWFRIMHFTCFLSVFPTFFLQPYFSRFPDISLSYWQNDFLEVW